MITDQQADAIVGQMFYWMVDMYPDGSEAQKNRIALIAVIIVDAVSEAITLQPLHTAYARAKAKRGIA
jgi:hypothetical protein